MAEKTAEWIDKKMTLSDMIMNEEVNKESTFGSWVVKIDVWLNTDRAKEHLVYLKYMLLLILSVNVSVTNYSKIIQLAWINYL